ncbi:hypothetical protein V8E51_002234 [Hyaloscypha variabilis]
MFTPSVLLLLASAGLIEARSVHEARHIHPLVHQRAAAGNSDSTATTLAANAIQSGSFNDGSLETGSDGATQALSQISQNNFINNCAGKTLTNGLQIVTGSCNGITMGDIPAKTAMVSSIITNPLSGSATIEADTTFNITVQTSNLVAGSFTNADATYYAAPQFLSGGKIVGHTHVTVQDLGDNLNPTEALDATQFAFFKGINDAGNGQGLLSAEVTGGLPAGNYRVCTMASASNHQPVLMPVAQRGTADDCTKFTVIGSGTTINVAANDGSKGIAAAAAAAEAVSVGPDVNISQTGTAASSTEAATSTSNSGKGGKSDTTTSDAATETSTNSGKNGKGKSDTTTSSSDTASTTSVADVSSADKGSKNKGSKTNSAASVVSTTVVKKVTVIESFFEFNFGLGGLPPSVSKKGDQFFVLEELFEDITLACGAACEQQFTSCTALEGPGFSIEECSTQKESCGSAASSQSSSTAAATITATVTVPPTATVTGSILSETTVSTTFTSSASQAAAAVTSAAAPVVTTPAAIVDNEQASSSVCTLTTSTVFVDEAPAATKAPASSEAAIAASSSTSCTTVATGTGSAALAVNTATLVADPSALGGIAAPPITDSGDSTRPFEVNGNTFVNKSAAVQRSCDIQFNACADAFNAGTASGFNISDCQTQEDTCISSQSA